MTQPVKVARVGDIPDGEGRKIPRSTTGTVDDIAVFNDEGKFFALDDTCSHEETSLAEGWVENETVECPLHSAKFCLRDGSVLCLPATAPVAAHEVVVDGEDIFVIPNESRLA